MKIDFYIKLAYLFGERKKMENVYYVIEDICVCCGAPVISGDMICHSCQECVKTDSVKQTTESVAKEMIPKEKNSIIKWFRRMKGTDAWKNNEKVK